MLSSIYIEQFISEANKELYGNILPFWMQKTPDSIKGGFWGLILYTVDGLFALSLIFSVPAQYY